VKVHVKHCRALKYCLKGTKLFFKKNDLNFEEFVTSGIDSELLMETKDAMAIALVKKAEEWADQVQ